MNNSFVDNSYLIIVDINIKNYQDLISKVENAEIVLLDSSKNGIEQITETLYDYQNLDKVSIVSHGEVGQLQIGNSLLNSNNLASYSSEISSWGEALTADGDFHLLGCNVAAGQVGLDFISNLAELTQADIAASNDITGVDGDWELEIVTGNIETEVVFNYDYDGNLAIKRVTGTPTPYQEFNLHRTIPLDKTDQNWEFAQGDYNNDGKTDIFAIRQQGANSTEIHILNGANNYQSYLLHTATALGKTGDSWEFEVADYNNDGKLDIVGIQQQGATGTEVHILNGANNYQNFLLHSATVLGKTGDSWEFEVADYNNDGKLDIVGIQQQGATETEVHILNGANNYQNFLLHSATALGKTGDNWEFEVGDYNNDDKLDLIAINKQGANSTEVHILNGANNYQNFLLHSATALGKTGDNWEFEVGDRDNNGTLDVFGIKKQAASGTELHFLRQDTRNYYWSDARIWGGQLPSSSDEVIIDADKRVILNQNTTVKNLQIDGTLIAQDRSNLSLSSDWIMVNNGKFQVGTEARPYQGNFTLTLEGDNKDLDIPRLGLKDNNAFLMARGENASVEIHGADRDKISSTQLGATVEEGSNRITLKEAVNWEVGDKIVVASTDFDMNQAEELTITGISNGGKTLTVDVAYNPKKLPLSYIASYPGLINAFGTNTGAGIRHYLNNGQIEGREVLFDGLTYLKQNPDLVRAGIRAPEPAAEHYIKHGRREGRTFPRLEDGAGLQYMHFGELQDYNNGKGRTWTLDQRAEVGLLSRNIKIQGDADSADNGYGGHMMIMMGAEARIEGVEFTRMGQKEKVGRYPFHWHMLGDASGQYFQDNSVHRTFNRAVTVHGTDNTVVKDNVAYDHIGHGYFLEDGSERGNLFEGNLGLVTRKLSAEEPTIPTDNTTVSTYWITNPDNTFRNNVAAGSDHGGFWFALPTTPTGESANRPGAKNIRPANTPIKEFTGNVGHSNKFSNLAIDGSINPKTLALKSGVSYRPRNDQGQNPIPVIRDFTGYKSQDRNLWLLAESMRLIDIKSADNGRATFFAYNQVMEDSLIVGRSANIGNPLTAREIREGRTLPASNNFRGHSIYDGPSGIVDIHFAGFSGNDPAIQTNGAAQKSTVHFAEGITFANDIPEANKVDFSPASNRGYMWSSGLLDRDGSITGIAGSRIMPIIRPDHSVANGIYDSGFNQAPNSFERPEWGAVINQDAHFGLLRVDPGWEERSAEQIYVTRSDGYTVTDDGTYNWYYQNPVIVNQDYSYRVDFPQIPNSFYLRLRFVDNNDWTIVEVPNVPSNIAVEDAIKVDSLAALRGEDEDAYFLKGNQLYVRLQGTNGGVNPWFGNDFSASSLVKVFIPDTDPKGRTTPVLGDFDIS